MPNVVAQSAVQEDGYSILVFLCPGCKYGHHVRVNAEGSNTQMTWCWNKSLDKPTFTPSILTRGEKVCHCYVTDGRIQFLGDCQHELANQTVDLTPWFSETSQ